MRCIPNMIVVAPCDAIEAKKATVAISKITGPCYARFAREATPVFTTHATPFKIGKAQTFRDGKDVAIIACGPLVYKALQAAEELSHEGVDVMVVNSHTIKPLDVDAVVAAAKKCRAIVTVEEHQIAGGLGSAVAECLAKTLPTPIEFIGVQDRFGESGAPEELLERFGMGVTHIKKAIKTILKRKKSK
jgi:transketolase